MSNLNEDWLRYNASEYTVNGKTYRNLEAQVLKNKQVSEKNAEDIANIDTEKVHKITFGETSFEDIYSNWTQGHIVICQYQGLIYILTCSTYNIAYFTNYRYIPQDTQAVIRGFRVDRTEGYEAPTQISTAASLNPLSDSSLPVAKAIADYVTDYVPDYVQSYITFTTGATDKYLREDGTWAELKKEAFIVNVTGDTSDQTRPASADKTWTEIWAAITENKEVICVFNYAYFRYMALGMDVTFPLIFSNNGAYTDTDRADTIQVNANNEWSRVTIATSPCITSVIETGDKLIVGHQDANGDKVAKGSIAFDTTQTDKYLCQDGTFKTVQGGGGSANVLKVSFTGTGTYTCDKTLAQILTAIAHDYIVYAIVNDAFHFQLDGYGATDVSFRRTWGEDYDGGVGVDWYTQTITIQNVGGNDLISSETLTSHVLN